jgi:hypothetical protein
LTEAFAGHVSEHRRITNRRVTSWKIEILSIASVLTLEGGHVTIDAPPPSARSGAPTEPPIEPGYAPLLPVGASLDVHGAINLLRDKVDLLQIQAAEKKRPWYRQASLLLSLFALAVSVTFSSLSILFRLQDKLDSSAATTVGRIRDDVTKLAELQIEQSDAMTRAGSNYQLLANLSSAYNTRRQLLIEETESLIKASSTQLTSALYVSFANQLAADMRIDDAAGYYGLALRRAATNLARSAVHRGYAMMLMQPGPQIKLEEGRQHWRSALSELDSIRDDNATFLIADDLRIWAFYERAAGDASRADSLIAEAQKTTARIASAYTRVQMQRLIADTITTLNGSSSPMVSKSVFGNWRIRFADGREGILSLSLNSYNQTWIALTTLMLEGRVVEIRQGSALPTDGSTIQFTWQSQRSLGLSTVLGSGAVRLSRNGTGGFSGTDEPLGGAPVKIDLTMDEALVDPKAK